MWYRVWRQNPALSAPRQTLYQPSHTPNTVSVFIGRLMPKPKHGCGFESSEEETPDFQWKGLLLCGMLSPEGGGFHLVAGGLFFQQLGALLRVGEMLFTSVPDLHCHRRRFGGPLWDACAHEQEYDVPPGNRGTGRKEQMGPLSFFLAQKMKGRENRYKKWKQLWQRSCFGWIHSQGGGACNLLGLCSKGEGGGSSK